MMSQLKKKHRGLSTTENIKNIRTSLMVPFDGQIPPKKPTRGSLAECVREMPLLWVLRVRFSVERRHCDEVLRPNALETKDSAAANSHGRAPPNRCKGSFAFLASGVTHRKRYAIYTDKISFIDITSIYVFNYQIMCRYQVKFKILALKSSKLFDFANCELVKF
jgi:hypothetical protein